MSSTQGTHITLQEAKSRYDAGVTLLDVREPDEWAAGHVKNALHIPRGQVAARVQGVLEDKTSPVVTYCAAGARAQVVAEAMRDMGYENVMPMEGGYSDWQAAGYPVDK